MTKEQLIERWKKRPYSWSQHSQFRDYSPEEWFQSYVLGIKKPSNKRMEYGSIVGKRIENDPSYIPQLPREGVCEYGVEVKMGKIDLVGYMDSFCIDKKIINEFKTSSPFGWNQDKVDDTYKAGGQLTFYCLLLLLKEKIKSEDLTIKLHHLHTSEKGDFTISFASPFTIDTYITKRTTAEVLKFGSTIIQQRKAMEKYILEHE